jgi:SAM-dependent methyltransferase
MVLPNLLKLCMAIALFISLMSTPSLADQSIYSTREQHHPDGIGKFYMGREIAQVMGHPGAGWLERSSRGIEERPQLAIDLLDLQATDTVADIGAGTGYFSFRMAQQVAQVYAVDIQPEMLEIVSTIQAENKIDNVETILGEATATHLPPNSIDLALMVDAYHEFAYPREMMQSIVAALKPGGRVALLEYKAENPLVMIKRLHKMSQAQVKAEMNAVGLTFVMNKRDLPQQHLLIFQKPLGQTPTEGQTAS